MTPDWDERRIDDLNRRWWRRFWTGSLDGVAILTLVLIIIVINLLAIASGC